MTDSTGWTSETLVRKGSPDIDSVETNDGGILLMILGSPKFELKQKFQVESIFSQAKDVVLC